MISFQLTTSIPSRCFEQKVLRNTALGRRHGADEERRHDHRYCGNQLDQHVHARSRGVLARVTHGIAHNGSFVRLRIFSTVSSRLDIFLEEVMDYRTYCWAIAISR